MASEDGCPTQNMDVDPQTNTDSTGAILPTETTDNAVPNGTVTKKIKTNGKVYEIKKTDTLINRASLESLISNIVKQVAETKVDDEATNKINLKLRNLERKSKELLKTTADCKGKLDNFQKNLEKEEEEENARHKLAEEDARDAELHKEREVIDVDSDDDIKIVGSNLGVIPPAGNVAKEQPLVLKMLTSTTSQFAQQPPTVDSMRKILTQTLQRTKGVIPGHAYSLKISDGKMQISPTQAPLAASQAFLPLGGQHLLIPPSPLPKEQQVDVTPWEQLKVGSRVFAWKKDDIWYPAAVLDIIEKNPDQKAYKVKFDERGNKIVDGRYLAYINSIQRMGRQVVVGSRVIANYREDESPSGNFYAGIVAEAPSLKNMKRYLIFFDDGYAQYSPDSEIHKVVWQSANVWDDIIPDSQEFIREYLKQYPERPMVRLQKGQTVKTEWNGKWWSAKVTEVDASLVKMYFHADRRTEWIYRGSTRLEPLYKALSNAEKVKKAATGEQHQVRRSLEMTSKKTVVEYTRGATEEDMNRFLGLLPTKPHVPPTDKKKPKVKRLDTGMTKIRKTAVAKKSTGNVRFVEENYTPNPDWVGPWMKMGRNKPATAASSTNRDSKDAFQTGSLGRPRDMASVLHERLTSGAPELKEKVQGERMDTVLDIKDKPRKQMIPHTCNPQCLRDMEEDPYKCKERNPLLIPLHCGWERQVCKHRPSNRRTVKYRAPCARSLRSMDEVDYYLEMTNSKLTIDLFCMDPELQVHSEFVSVKTFMDIKDLSYGKEEVPISCTNTIDRQYPDYVEYCNHRIPAKGVVINTNPEFMSFCDCTDNCRDKSKCACQQLTIQQTMALGECSETAGYTNRLLKEPILTGIYECNPRCKCNKRCHNRVAQNGLRRRLQVFKTDKRGWGLRCLDDIPQGGFICIYAGQLLTEKGANEDGKQYGDEYLAELDFMEVVEKNKEGYESDVADPDNDLNSEDEEEDEEDDDENLSGDDISTPSSDSSYNIGSRQRLDSSEKKIHITRKQTRMDSDEAARQAEAAAQKPAEGSSAGGEGEWSHQKRTQDWVETVSKTISVDEEDSGKQSEKEGSVKKESEGQGDKRSVKKEEGKDTPVRMVIDYDDELPDLDTDSPFPLSSRKTEDTQDMDSEEDEDSGKNAVARKRTGGSRFKNLPNPKLQSDDSEEKPKRIPMRSYFENEQNIYIMDAKSMGNIGRYLNHSCSPNVFVQNVFVDTHDLRFPWVAFFANRYIQAGKELTWDYNYEVGSVSDKVLYCYCGSNQCRGRLL